MARTLRSVPALLSLIVLVGGGFALLTSAPSDLLPSNSKARFADSATVNFVRPGLKIQILSAEASAGGVVKTKVRFTDPRGVPLDKDGIETPGAIRAGAPGMLIAYVPKGGTKYVNYITRTATDTATGNRASQATSENNGTWTKLAPGDYEYTFRLVLPSGYDRTATHTVGVFGIRDLGEFDLGIDEADAVFHFVPDGSKPQQTPDVVKTAQCRGCHDNMRFNTHTQSGRISVEMCVLCHNPKSFDPNGESLEMSIMVHRIHMGSDLPSVLAGGKFEYRGKDYSKTIYSADKRACATCHSASSGAVQADFALTKPTRAACGSCHDNVNFQTGENHLNMPQISDNQCANCHIREGEVDFDASVIGAHRIPRQSPSLQGVVFTILDVANGSAGKQPTVTFTIKDKAGNPLNPAFMSRLRITLAGPTSDYTTYVTEDALKAPGGPDGRYWYTFTRAIPADAKGTYSVTIEGGNDVKLLAGTLKETVARERGQNKTAYFSVDGTPVAKRRTVVTMEKCNSCHEDLAFHGESRNTTEYCVTCHNPTNVSSAYKHTLNFMVMIHRIHAGSSQNIPFDWGATRPYSRTVYPSNLANCATCHVNNSQLLPLKQAIAPVLDPTGRLSPVAGVTGACISCHSSVEAVSHTLANTTSLGESCGACHSTGKQFAVDKVHAQ